MAEVQATKSPSENSVATPQVTPYGIVKRIRYMVNSTPELMEILHGVNQMYNRLEDPEENRTLQQSCRIDIIPLPYSESKFIISFSVPSELLGAVSNRRTRKLDFADYCDSSEKAQIIKKPPKLLLCYDVDSLFDLNLAFYSFQAKLAPAVPTAQWSRVRRSIEVVARPRQSTGDKLKIIIIAEVIPAIEID